MSALGTEFVDQLDLGVARGAAQVRGHAARVRHEPPADPELDVTGKRIGPERDFGGPTIREAEVEAFRAPLALHGLTVELDLAPHEDGFAQHDVRAVIDTPFDLAHGIPC